MRRDSKESWREVLKRKIRANKWEPVIQGEQTGEHIIGQLNESKA